MLSLEEGTNHHLLEPGDGGQLAKSNNSSELAHVRTVASKLEETGTVDGLWRGERKFGEREGEGGGRERERERGRGREREKRERPVSKSVQTLHSYCKNIQPSQHTGTHHLTTSTHTTRHYTTGTSHRVHNYKHNEITAFHTSSISQPFTFIIILLFTLTNH